MKVFNIFIYKLYVFCCINLKYKNKLSFKNIEILSFNIFFYIFIYYFIYIMWNYLFILFYIWIINIW